MTKVKSTKDISFPSLDWGISAGDEKELPNDKDAQDRILEESCISIVGNEEKVDNKLNNKSNKDNK